MVSYKKKYEEILKDYKKLIAWCIDLTPEAKAYRVRSAIPTILQKSHFRIEEQDDKYLLYDVIK